MNNVSFLNNDTKLNPLSPTHKKAEPSFKEMSTFKKVAYVALAMFFGAIVGSVIGCIPVVAAAIGTAGVIALGCAGAALGLVIGARMISKQAPEIVKKPPLEKKSEVKVKAEEGKIVNNDIPKTVPIIIEPEKIIEEQLNEQQKLEEAAVNNFNEIKKDPKAAYEFFKKINDKRGQMTAILKSISSRDLQRLVEAGLHEMDNEDPLVIEKEMKVICGLLEEQSIVKLGTVIDSIIHEAVEAISIKKEEKAIILMRLCEWAYGIYFQKKDIIEHFSLLNEALEKLPMRSIESYFRKYLEVIRTLNRDIPDDAMLIQAMKNMFTRVLGRFETKEQKFGQALDVLVELAVESLNETDHLHVSQRKCFLIIEVLIDFNSDKKRIDRIAEEISQKKGAEFFKYLYKDKNEHGVTINFEKLTVDVKLFKALTSAYLNHILNLGEKGAQTVAAISFCLTASSAATLMNEDSEFINSLPPSKRKLFKSMVGNDDSKLKGSLITAVVSTEQGALSVYEAVKESLGLTNDLIKCCPPNSLKAIRDSMPKKEQSSYIWPDLVDTVLETILKEFEEVRREKNTERLYQLLDFRLKTFLGDSSEEGARVVNYYEEIFNKLKDEEIERYLNYILEKMRNSNEEESQQEIAKAAQLNLSNALEVMIKDEKKRSFAEEFLLKAAISSLDEGIKVAQKMCLTFSHYRTMFPDNALGSMKKLVKEIKEKHGAAFFVFTDSVGKAIRNFKQAKDGEGALIENSGFKNSNPEYPTIKLSDLEVLTEIYLIEEFRAAKVDEQTVVGADFYATAYDLLTHMVELPRFINQLKLVDKSRKTKRLSIDESIKQNYIAQSSLVTFMKGLTHPTLKKCDGTLVMKTLSSPESAIKLFKKVTSQIQGNLLRICPTATKEAIWKILSVSQIKEFTENQKIVPPQ